MKNFLQFILAAVLALSVAASARAQISEPDTIFYGTVINRTSGQLARITDGTLQWAVLRPDGKTLTLTAKLQPLANGLYSYRMAVPQQALTFGLTVADSAVPLSTATATCSHVLITVDGNPASILAPGTSTFNVAQSLRASTYRLDLELFNPLASTSGDGIPDWWKTKYGVYDPNADSDGDGWSNLLEFQRGTDPNHDDRLPSLGTTEYWAYADGYTAIPFDALDSDTGPANLHYTLTSLPANGTFYLHNVNNDGSVNDIALPLNGFFSQADVDAGKLIFVHNGTNAPADSVTFTLNLADENPAHGTNYTIRLNQYRPGYSAGVATAAKACADAPFGFSDVSGLAFGEQQMLINYYLSRDHGYILSDSSRSSGARTLRAASSAVTAGQDHSQVFVGGAGDDRLVGGTSGDIFIGGRGKNILRGNGGADLFLLSDANSGGDTIEDFNVTDGDALDISRALVGLSTQLTNYVQLTPSGTNTLVGISTAGKGGGFTNIVITLLGRQFTQNDLRTLSDNGNLLTGNKAMAAQVSVVASLPAASQNGPTSGQFLFFRTGPVTSSLTISVLFSGTAVNGTAYEFIPSTLTFAAGQRTLNVDVKPFQTSSSLTTIAQVNVAAGSGYELGASTSAQVSIEPLAPQITIEAIAPTALRSDLTPGTFLVSRGGILDRSVLVRLNVGGSASTTTDYAAVSTFLNFSPNQTTALVTITPKSTANVANGAKYVQISIKPDASYKVMNPAVDRVYILDQMLDHATWQQHYFGSSANWGTFSQQDSGNTGIRNLERYVYGLNPTNPVAANGLPFYRIVDDHLAVTFRRPLAITDYDYVVQVSSNLVNWSSLASELEQFLPSDANTNDVESVSYRTKALVHGLQYQYMRVKLQPR